MIGTIALGSRANAKDTWSIFDPPASINTVPQSINSHGQIAGQYQDSDGVFHSFLRASDGTLTVFDEPDATQGTFAKSINNAGDVTGYFNDDSGTRGFLCDSGGTFTAFQYKNYPSTKPIAINGRDTIVGQASNGSSTQAFLRKPNGTYRSLGLNLSPLAINVRGIVVGTTSPDTHGFIGTSANDITTFDPPNSAYTQPYAINASGVVAGYFHGVDNVNHGFLRTPDGTIVTFDAPNAGTTSNTGTFVNAIDIDGDIAGTVVDSSNHQHGFVREAYGAMHLIDAPGATNTKVLAIGPGGKIIGVEDRHGFEALARVWKTQ